MFNRLTYIAQLGIAALFLSSATFAATTTATPARWSPQKSTTWQWQLSGPLRADYNVDMYDVDLFDTSVATITILHAAGRRVVCYFSAGSSENWRPDFAQFVAGDMGSPLDDWVGERWLNIASANVRRVIKLRLDTARAKGCDGVEPDNVDGYTNANGMALTARQQLDFNRFIAAEAHARGLAVGLKNDVDQLADLAPYFDFAVNEQCHQYEECGGYAAFTRAGKPVFVAEYARKYRYNQRGARDAMCAASRSSGLQTLVLPLQLDGRFRLSC